MNVPAHIDHWRKGAEEALEFAEDTVQRGKIEFGLFFAHLALEKALKAHVCKATSEVPPFIHNLVKLAETAQLSLTEEQVAFLDEMIEFNTSGRYSEFVKYTPTKTEARDYLKRSKEMIEWLIQKL